MAVATGSLGLNYASMTAADQNLNTRPNDGKAGSSNISTTRQVNQDEDNGGTYTNGKGPIEEY